MMNMRACFLRKSWPIVLVSTAALLAGHSSVNTTLRYYSRVDTDDLRAGVEKLYGMAAV